jgi:hypothetical protein
MCPLDIVAEVDRRHLFFLFFLAGSEGIADGAETTCEARIHTAQFPGDSAATGCKLRIDLGCHRFTIR